MSEPARKRATYQDVLNAPPEMIAEIIDGELYLHARPAPPHADASIGMVSTFAPLRLRRGEDRSGGWRLLFEPELHLADQLLVPDIAAWRLERMPKVPRAAFITLAPDWVCEILSPSTASIDRTSKMRIYARNHVQHVWLVDPVLQLLEVYQLAGEFWQRIVAITGAQVCRLPPFENVEFDLTLWWGDLEDLESSQSE